MRIRASGTSAIASSPRAVFGAMRASQRPRPPSRIGRPWPSVTDTRRPAAPWRTGRDGGVLLSGSTAVGVVRLDDLLHERVANDIFLVEANELDAFDVADDLHRLDQPGGPADRQVDLGDVA